jgi:two-component system, OmpR family, phosphate regulon sensor histidine kinase PhoR
MSDAKVIFTGTEQAARIRAPNAAPPQGTWTASGQFQGITDFETVLLAIAGHDMRQPLQIIQSTHELLGIGLRTSSELKYLRLGQDAIDRLKEQLAQLVTALRIQGQTGTLELTPIPVQQVLNEADRENEDAAFRKGISLRTVASDAVIKSNSFLLGAALRNLVSNAVKYTRPGGQILVGCRRNCTSLRIDVYDTGIGIPGEHAPQMFEAFTRLDTVQRDGLGIGLFIVRQALGLLGHRIEVASSPSRGSRFSIVAPRLEVPVPPMGRNC